MARRRGKWAMSPGRLVSQTGQVSSGSLGSKPGAGWRIPMKTKATEKALTETGFDSRRTQFNEREPMDAKHAASHLRNRGTFYGDSVYDEIADLIESLARERDKARERGLTDDDIDDIDRVAKRLASGPPSHGDDQYAAACLRAIVRRLRPAPIEWHRAGTTSVAVIGGVTYTVLKSSRGWWWLSDGTAMNGHKWDTREDAEAAAEKHARENQ